MGGGILRRFESRVAVDEAARAAGDASGGEGHGLRAPVRGIEQTGLDREAAARLHEESVDRRDGIDAVGVGIAATK